MAYNAATVLQVISDPPVQKGMLKTDLHPDAIQEKKFTPR